MTVKQIKEIRERLLIDDAVYRSRAGVLDGQAEEDMELLLEEVDRLRKVICFGISFASTVSDWMDEVEVNGEMMGVCEVKKRLEDALCDDIDRLRAGKPKPQGKTVRARVAVAVDEFENWSASGWDGARDDEMKDGILDLMEGATVLYWLTADLPVPEEQTVEAEVES